MVKRKIMLMAALLSGVIGLQALVHSTVTLAKKDDQPKKVYVCKYVGTPEIDERLKEGKNPISVSVTADEERVPGTYFNDAQGRSYVVAYDEGQTAPDIDSCPGPVAPNDIVISLPDAPAFTDPCGPNNAGWTIPIDTDRIKWAIVNGDLIVSTLKGFIFDNKTTSHNFGKIIDSQITCPINLVIVDPPKTLLADICSILASGKIKLPANTDKIHFSLTAVTRSSVTVTLTAQPGFAFDAKGTTVLTVTVSLSAHLTCPGQVTPTPTPPAITPTPPTTPAPVIPTATKAAPKSSATTVTELPRTGAGDNALLIAIVLGVATYAGFYYLRTKQHHA